MGTVPGVDKVLAIIVVLPAAGGMLSYWAVCGKGRGLRSREIRQLGYCLNGCW